jgi:UDP-N-acetylglucosamine:LPS N-acetylglucosamine transferase
MKKAKKICIVSSCGGHLTEIRMLKPIYSEYEYFYVLNDQAILADDMKDKTYFITHAERNLKIIKNFFEAFRIIWKERPNLFMSTGAGAIVVFSILGRILGIKTIYIETLASAEKPTLTGRLMYRLANYFYYQWPHLKEYFPKGECIGTLL